MNLALFAWKPTTDHFIIVINMQSEEKHRCTRMLPRLLLLLGVFFFLLFGVYPSHAAEWRDAERACLRTCPSMPRYSGVESDGKYKERMRKQAAYDKCFMDCARQSSSMQARTFVPIGESETNYFKRNGYKIN